MIVTRDEDIRSICAEIRTWKFRGVDTETTGLGADDRLFSIIVSNGGRSYYFNFNDRAPETSPLDVLDREPTCALLAEALGDVGTTTFIANAKFDLRILEHEGIRINGEVHCTEAAERVLQNNHFGTKPYSLAACAARRGWAKDDAVDAYITKHKLYRDISVPGKKRAYRLKFFDQVPFPIMSKYAEMDGHLHYSLGMDQIEAIKRISDEAPVSGLPGLERVFENEKALTKVFYKMERAGIKIDRPYVDKALAYEMEQIKQAKRAFSEITGDTYIESRAAFVELFTRLGEKYPLTAKGNPSFAADVLEEMTTPAAAVINRIRYHEKRASTYYSAYLHFAGGDDVIHANIRQGGTETGRVSYSDPNLQNISKEDEEEDQAVPFHIRDSFVPRDNAFFYAIDYEQMEYRMMLDYAGEMELIKLVMAGEDVHKATAQLVFGMSDTKHRKLAKNLNFAFLYGAGVGKVALMSGKTVREARELKDLYFGKLPRVEEFIDAVNRSGVGRGFIFNWLGRRCHIARRSDAYVLPNHLVQGSCADVVKVAMVRIQDRLDSIGCGTKMIMQVHDELLFEVPNGEEDIFKEIVPIMEGVYPSQNGIVLTTSLEHAYKGWGVRNKVGGPANGKIAV